MKHFVKKLGCVCLTLVMLLAIALPAAAEDLPVATAIPANWDGTVATAFAGGTGTEADPYLISNAQELALIASTVNATTSDYLGVYFKQTADINLAGAVWNSIGNGKTAVSFKGVYDGGNFTIYNIINIPVDPADASTMIYNGLFGWIADPAVIRNVKMVGGSVTSTKYGAAIVGYMNGGTIYNCVSDIDTIYGFQSGGIVGRAEKGEKNIIKACVNYSTVTTPEDGTTASSVFSGGIAGCAGNAEILYCVNYGDITSRNGTSYSVAGGIVGIQGASSSPTIINNCADMGVITAYEGGAKNVGAGGICGKAGHVSFSDISNSFSAGTYTSDKEGSAGGIAGIVDASKIVTIENLHTSADKAAGTDDMGQLGNTKLLKADDMTGSEGIAKMGLDRAWVAEVSTFPYVDVAKLEAAEQEPEPEPEPTTTTAPEVTTTEPEETTTEPEETTTEPEETTTEPEETTTEPKDTDPVDPGEPTTPVEPKTRDNTVLIIILSIAIVAVAGGMVAIVIISKKKQ